MDTSPSYDLWYWSEIPGRGEFVRLALEAGGIPYRDRAREDGDEAMTRDMEARRGHGPFAPPYIVAGELCIAQTGNILDFLARRHGLAPGDEGSLHFAQQLFLTMLDALDGAHNVHHPISGGLYYRDQKAEALRAAKAFREERIPKFLGYFEAVLEESGPWLVGATWSYADLALFQLVRGLDYAFPRCMAALREQTPLVFALLERVQALPDLADYFASARRLPFNEDGIFRHYPELDPP